MAEPADRTEAPNAAEGAEYGLDESLVHSVVAALAAGEPQRAADLVRPLHPSDVADLLELLSPDERRALVETMRDSLDPEVLLELADTVRDDVIQQLGVQTIAAAVAELDSDDAVGLLVELEAAEQREILDAIPAGERTLIEEGLTYPEDSAGRLMQREVVTVPTFWTVGETIDYMRKSADLEDNTLPEVFYDIFVVDPLHRPVGAIPLSRLLRTGRPVPVSDVMETKLNTIPVSTDQEEVARLFRKRDLVSAPVVDGGGRLVGAITVDDVVDVIDEEAEEDLLRLGRVGESDLHLPAWTTAFRRVRWLLVALINSILAAIVISQFEASIEKLVALAILMPIVAAMGGNAGIQVVTVTVRSLATRELTAGNMGRAIVKEAAVGLINGAVLAAIMGVIAGLWFDYPELGLVLAVAMTFNMLWAALAGTLIPLALDRFGVDPAVAAGPFLITTTDVLGFFVFLGLGAWFLL